MKELTQVEATEIIARFMGYSFKRENCYQFNGGPITGEPKRLGTVYTKNESDFYTGSNGQNMVRLEYESYKVSNCIINPEYHSSWDWLMPVWSHFRYLVWEKKEGYPKEFEKFKDDFMIGVFNGSIITCQRVMVEAIQWYNENKPK